jgi:hypothetical protein
MFSQSPHKFNRARQQVESDPNYRSKALSDDEIKKLPGDNVVVIQPSPSEIKAPKNAAGHTLATYLIVSKAVHHAEATIFGSRVIEGSQTSVGISKYILLITMNGKPWFVEYQKAKDGDFSRGFNNIDMFLTKPWVLVSDEEKSDSKNNDEKNVAPASSALKK